MYVFKCDNASSVRQSAAEPSIRDFMLAMWRLGHAKFGLITFAAGRHDEIVAGDSSRSRAESLEQRSGKHRGRRLWQNKTSEQSSRAKGEVEGKEQGDV